MDAIALAVTIVVAIVSFLAGWLVRTEPMRKEVYVRKLDAYLNLNALGADLLHKSIKASVDAQQFARPMYEARLALGEYVASHSILISNGLGPYIEALGEAKEEPDIETLRGAFNLMCSTMASELKIEEIHKINASLLGFPRTDRAC